MLDILLSATAAQLGKVVFDQVLELGQGALEDYAKDFFKDSLGSGVAKLKASVLQGPMGEAIVSFIKAFIQELKDNDVPDSSINHHYTKALRGFVKDKSVKPILGKAFETEYAAIDHKELQRIWTDHHQQSGWQFPEEDFRWRRVGKAYVQAVKEIVKANEELRSLLNTNLLEKIAQNTTPLSPGFDVDTYRQSLQSSYGYLKLYTLDSTDRVDAIKLWNMFIEQTVREALPPTRYDLPSDIKRQLSAEGQLEDAPSPEELEHYRRDYFQQPARKALEAVMDGERSVILGDPGAGKSTLLQYLALEWVEGKSEPLPLIIELREYALAKAASFFDFLHCGSGADWQFDQQKLHQHLLEQPTVVMFDGLDEVFDRPTQSAIIDDIIRFAQQYPQARVIVTSRIIGYNPERFQHADFRQFTIQPLDETEMHEFIDRWYDLAMGVDQDKVRLKGRLKEAIAQSKAIQNLADNPLLLTMMAILNRRQELPRDRADLYDQASRVLLYHWDVDHKRLQLPLDAIGRREKQEMLRLIAYEMQAGEEGLKGNLISAERLTKILTDYLINQGFSEPREKAHRLIQQLRERNFILCYRGADTYGFMHRTFLEYFCAVEIVHRFEKQRTLTFEQLRDDIFGGHWQDETWYEPLRLICGMVDYSFAEQLIDCLMDQPIDKQQFTDVNMGSFPYLQVGGVKHLLLAADCFSDSAYTGKSSNTSQTLLKKLKAEIELISIRLMFETAFEIFDRILINFPEELKWVKGETSLKTLDMQSDMSRSAIRSAAVNAIARHNKASETFEWLKSSLTNNDWALRRAAVWALPQYYKHEQEILALLIARLKDDDRSVRCAAIKAISQYFRFNSYIENEFFQVVQNDACIPDPPWLDNPRQVALEALIKRNNIDFKVKSLLGDRATNDPDPQLREWAQKKLEALNREDE